jgi:hypothetical protein
MDSANPPAIYPKVKGIQVMNDMGQYMFSGYAGKWIPDTPGRRRIILDRLQGRQSPDPHPRRRLPTMFTNADFRKTPASVSPP